MRRFQALAVAVTFVWMGVSAQPTAPPPPEKVVEQLWSMATTGELLTPGGWKKASRFFAQPSPLPDHYTVHVFSNSYGVAPAHIEGSAAKLIVWCADVGKIDAELRFTPAPPATSYKSWCGYRLVLDSVASKNNAIDGSSTTRAKGPPEWKIDAPQGEPFTTVNTAIRYVLERRDYSTDSVIRKNADKTLTSLMKYH